ncbi:hypothetical protein DCAR_0521526 [Daucus carota subsp. sativus]|uniref:Protein disulfide-isomerase n=1 Tax=Daucus carota subsp. sativus TaxID=79200 RepID=A0A164Z9N3_DAUCS|nr:PREDICTED: protein disulfide isomerase-like 1-4 [Daucus carota subsp. sativus]WOH02138.1 hypothetical protein DCAR_0521526 [Daucus carota subsp. sativus]
MASRLVLVSLISLLLFSLLVSPSLSKSPAGDDTDDDEDLTFLEDDAGEDDAASHDDSHFSDPEHSDAEFDDDFNYDDFDSPAGSEFDEYGSSAEFDESDVVVLNGGNFSEFIEKNRYVLVEFYAPWCGHCQALAPEYAAAATELKGEKVVLAKVEATEESELAEKYEVQGFPTIYFFVDGVHKVYAGQRTKDGIVTWIKKKVGPGIYNITTTEDAERILTSEDKIVLGYLNSLVGPESDELAAASVLEDDVNFYQTVNPSVAKLFKLEDNVKLPALVLLKKEAEKVSHYDGPFVKSAIAEFVFENKLPLVTTFTREAASLIFESTIKKQLLLFATLNDTEKVLPIFQEAAKHFKGKLICVYVQMDNEDVGKPVSDYFGITGDAPQILGYTGNDDARKFFLSGEVTVENIKAFGEDFVEDKLKPFYKSDPIPETNDGDVKIVVGNNFDELVLDESKDVLLEIYAPWCGHCQSLEPTYNKLAKHLRSVESLVIAKMDGTTNEHPRAKSDGFPTLLFFPAGNKSFDPITVDVDRTVVAFYKFLKKHASVPFKLQKPATTPTSPDAEPEAKESTEAKPKNLKDEL